jgi:hypothetical protein
MDNPETFKNGQFRDIQEWTIQRHSRMDNPETFKNGQSRDIQEWTIQRHSRMDNPETFKNGQSRDTVNVGHKIQKQQQKHT